MNQSRNYYTGPYERNQIDRKCLFYDLFIYFKEI